MSTVITDGVTPTGQGTGFSRRLPGIGKLFAVASLLIVAGCKVEVTVPEGGTVTSDMGFNCSSGQTCEVDVTSTEYEENFLAVPDAGYVFKGWKKAQGYTCGDSSLACTVTIAALAGNPVLEPLLDDNTVVVKLEPVFEADDDRYNLAQWQAALATINAAEYRSDEFLYQVLPDEGNCDPGVLSLDAAFRFSIAVNMIRQLHNLPPVTYDGFYAAQAQETNLVQLANNYFTHYPQEGDQCYSAGAAAGAGSSNISWASWQGDPAWYAFGWVNDNHNVSNLMAAGHRRWALNPNLGYTTYGQVGGYSSMKVFGFGAAPTYTLPEDLEYVAFPYRNYPYIMVESGAYPTPWSISIVPESGNSPFAYFASATVTVREVATGNALNVHSNYTDTYGYGLRNFLSWMVDGWDYDTQYLVTIENIQMPDGTTKTIEYPVEIDLEEYAP